MTIGLSPDLGGTGAPVGLAQRLQVLNQSQLDAVHAAALRILERVGVRVDHAPAVDLLRANGARSEGDTLRLPASLVERCLDSAPAQVTLHARDPRHDVLLGRGRVHFTNGFGATWVDDLETGQVRPATLEDLAALTRLADALDRVDYCLFAVVPQDIPARLMDVECTATALLNTSKHVQLSLETADWVSEVLAMGRAVADPGRPSPISAGGVPHSPLHYTADVAAKFMALARAEVPCFIVDGAMAGATAPVTLGGALALQNAEVLAGIVIHQLAAPGAPVVYGTFAGGFDMRVAKLALGGPELSLITAATQQLCERYGVPLGYATAGMTDSAVTDVQYGMEKAASLIFAAAAGVDVIHDGASGLYGGGMVTGPAQMVIDDEMCSAAAYWLQGIPVTEETLAEEVTLAVGAGGNFLETDHTLRHFRRSLYLAPLRSRNLSPAERQGAPSEFLERASRRAREVLSAHRPLPLHETQRRELEAIRLRARQRAQGA